MSRVWRRSGKSWDRVKEFTNDVCGIRHVLGQSRKGSEWWSEEVGVAVKEKRRTFEEWLQRLDRYDRHRAYLARVKLAVKLIKLRKNGGLAMGRAIGE